MKQINYFIIIVLTIIGCDTDQNANHLDPIKSIDGYIVGFDPCTINMGYQVGYVIISIDTNDTLVTYNLSDTLFQFAPELFANYRNSAYFPDSVQNKFKIRVEYRRSKANELNFNACSFDINGNDFHHQFEFNQVIILSTTKL